MMGSVLEKVRELFSPADEDDNAICVACPCFPSLSICGKFEPDYTWVAVDEGEDCASCEEALDAIDWKCPRCGRRLDI